MKNFEKWLTEDRFKHAWRDKNSNRYEIIWPEQTGWDGALYQIKKGIEDGDIYTIEEILAAIDELSTGTRQID